MLLCAGAGLAQEGIGMGLGITLVLVGYMAAAMAYHAWLTR